MVIGIDASRAFLSKRTGIEEYSYQVIKHLRDTLPRTDEVILYTRPGQEPDFSLPEKWRVKPLWAPRFWTQIRLALEMLIARPDVLFVPAHTVPWIHPEKTVVTIHGLEYELCTGSYSPWEYWYMRLSIKNSVRFASTIVAVSENTKSDLLKLYRVPREKIVVVGEGFALPEERVDEAAKPLTPYFLFIGRLEERKNIVRIIEAFEVFKRETGSSHQLILAGKFGYGKEKIQKVIEASRYKKDIVLPGYVSEEEKWRLLRGASVLVFPTLYEGFGIPVLEAQAVGIPVITSVTSSLPEVAGKGALLVEPMSVEAITGAMVKLVSDETLRTDIIEKGRSNTLRFQWKKTAIHLQKLLS